MSMLSRRQFLAAAAAAVSSAAQPSRPNILFIMSDDHAAHAISAYGSRINRTPHIDRLAKEGMRLDHCLVTNSICTPSRAVILTGLYSHLNGVKTLADPIDPARDHVAKRLQKAGYQTAIIGKWHLHTNPAGFDHWNILPGQGLYHNPDFIENGTRSKRTGYCTDLIGDYTIDFLNKRDKSKPFFVMCHHKAPHRAWQPDEKKMSMFENETIPEPETLFDDYRGRGGAAERAKMRVGEDMSKTDLKVDRPAGLEGKELRRWAYQIYIKDYLRCISSVDDNVGKVLDYLDREGLAANTIVIYTSDQGFFLGDHGWYDKRFMYEESLRQPFLIRWPGRVKPGSVNKDMALNLDFAPTFLEMAGEAAPPEMQGHSLVPLLSGRTPKIWRKEMYYRYWMHLADHNVAAHYGIRTERYKLIYYYGRALGSKGSVDKDTTPEWELFDLAKDPHELRSVYGTGAYSKVEADLKARLARLQAIYKDTPV